MDFSDINNVASRKRVYTDAEKLREKMSRESSKIIKLRVAQDTAYWDLKERLSGVQSEHERLQQNMLDVQMQHEALSAQYQDELRLRPETLNKLARTRDICDVLEEYAGRVRASLRRAGADRDALAQAYAAAARRVSVAHAQHARAADAAQLQVVAKTDQLRLSAERGAQLAECASDARRHAEAALEASRAQLAAATERAERLQARADELRDRAASAHADLQQRERTIVELQREAERRTAESASEAERAARDRTELERKVEEGRAALEASREALAAANERAARGAEQAARARDDAENLERIIADLRRELETVRAASEALQRTTERKHREASESAARAEAARGEADAGRAELQAEREARARDAAAAGAALAERADTVARLMRDVAQEAEARARCDAALHAAGDRARALADKLQINEEQLAGQMKIVLEMRGEKERLQDIIRKMQGTIDNIQKELTREPPAAAHAAAAASAARREPPEHDDNALPAPPTPLRERGTPAPDAGGVFLTPRPRATNADDQLYHFLSDSSMDADALDPREVNLRFEALLRGTAPPATSLHALKRRHANRTQGGAAGAEADMSLSQVKTELAARGRTFFRNKRLDAKPKKLK